MDGEFVMPRELPVKEVPDLSGLDDDFLELKKLNADLASSPDEYEPWDALVKAAESTEGGQLNRNSSPQAIAATREIYDRFLAKFPLFFVYWKRYADLEFYIAGTEAAEMVYERGVASVGNSVDLWTNYCTFKVETSHDPELIRELFERGASCVGLDFRSDPFWNKYMEFEDRAEAPEKTYAILNRLIHIPTEKSREHFDRLRTSAQYRPLTEIALPEVLESYRSDLVAENPNRSAAELERDIRVRIDQSHLEIYTHTANETAKRAAFEDGVKRPYFHVTDVPDTELTNWRKYLDFEETEGDYHRIVFLYERCLVVCALHEEYWLRYARWMQAQPDRVQEVRNILERASCIYVPMAKPKVRLHYAIFEETEGRVDVARDIHHAILHKLPSNIETIVSLANLQRRQGGIDDAIAVYTEFLQSSVCDIFVKGFLVAEWATLLWKIKGAPEEARQVYQKQSQYYGESRPFWVSYFTFEIQQPTNAENESRQYERIKGVFHAIFTKSLISPSVIKDIGHLYLEYLLQRGSKDAAKEYLKVDRDINGPISIRSNKTVLPEDNSGLGGLFLTGQSELNDSALRLGLNVYDRYHREPVETLAVPNGHPSHSGTHKGSRY